MTVKLVPAVGLGTFVVGCMVAFGACGRSEPIREAPPDGGLPDGGQPDGGSPDGGAPDGGSPHGGSPDGGFTINCPDASGWQFFGTQHGGPQRVNGITSDPSGNLWVAGGAEGLFLLKPGDSRYHRYTMADGLRPYGYMPDGSDPPGEKHLNVLSVAGGPAGSVFVGYEGKPPAAGQNDCELNWYYPQGRDPSIYKSGDADRVTLQSSDRISVVHYDISTGPGLIADEPEGREKLCTILRIAYHPATNSVWFG